MSYLVTVPGAFTGASRDQKGLFAEADKGTIFLDEIGEMPLDLQAKLLRVLETHEFLRVGDTKPTKTGRARGSRHQPQLRSTKPRPDAFRLDLYYRLSVFSASNYRPCATGATTFRNWPNSLPGRMR